MQFWLSERNFSRLGRSDDHVISALPHVFIDVIYIKVIQGDEGSNTVMRFNTYSNDI